MKYCNLAISLLLLSFFTSCQEDSVEKRGIAFQFRPRECTQIITLPMQSVVTTETVNGQTSTFHRVEPIPVVKEDTVEAKNFVLWMMTGADDLKEMEKEHPNVRDRSYENIYQNLAGKYNRLAAPIPVLEGELEADYRTIVGTRTAGTDAAHIEPWSYRVTGMKDFKIICLSPLYGRPAESSLNSLFAIQELRPRQVISQSRHLLWGYRDKEEITDMSKWLDMKPMAPPVAMFRFNPEGSLHLPMRVSFVSILETTDGTVLRDTVKVVLK